MKYKVSNSGEWGESTATNNKAFNGFNMSHQGTSKQEVYGVTDNGEQMFDVYKQRMLIVVFDSARVFDPGGESTMYNKYQSNLLIKQ